MAEISSTGDQMLTVLETVAKHGPITVAEVVRLCEMNRTVVHRLLTTLETRAYVRRAPAGFVLGSAVIELARQLETDISSIAKSHMDRMAERTGETVVLHCVDKDDAMVVEQSLGGQHLVRVQHTPGSRHPLYQGASGWALLAFQDEKTIARLLRRVTGAAAARDRLQEIRNLKYAISHDELQMGVHGVAAPLFDRAGNCIASVAILVPAARMDKLNVLLPELIAGAVAINTDLQREA